MKVLSDISPRWEPFAIAALLLITVTAPVATAQTPPPRDARPPSPSPSQAGAPRDRVPPRTTGTAAVKGRVVDGVTGSPIARARIRYMGSGAANRAMALTDGEGAFRFTGLPAGSFTLSVEKSTYMAARLPDQPRTMRMRFTPNILTDGQTSDVTIKLFHGGVITGRVVDSYGDPVENTEVRAMFVPRGRPATPRSSAMTNDIGEFRLSRLEPGRYVLSVTPRPNNNGNDDPLNTPGLIQSQPTPVFYPGPVEIGQGLALNRGETLSGIEIVLGEGLPTIITGMVVVADGPLGNINGSVTVRYASSGAMSGPFVSGTGIREDGSFRLQLPAGQYNLDAQVSHRMSSGEGIQPSRLLTGMTSISVGGGQVEPVTIVVGNGATATGRVVFEGTTPPPSAPVGKPTRVPLFSEDMSLCRSGDATIAEDWTFKIDGLIGTCSAPPTNILGRWTLKSVKIGGTNVIDKPVTFEQGRQYSGVEIVVTDKPPTIEVKVAGDDGQLTREYVALAFPIERSTWKNAPRTVRVLVPRPMTSLGLTVVPGMSIPPSASRESDERIAGLLGGEYYVIALDDIETEDAFDPAVLEKLAPHATRVNLAAEGVVELSLQRFKVADLVR
jgi:hypothetical protein